MAPSPVVALGLTARPTGDAAAWTGLARRAEAVGFTTLHVADHVMDELMAPVPALMAAADATAALRVGPLVANNELRHPVLLARDVAAVHWLSSGRAEIGIGAGHARSEHVALGVPFRDAAVRVARLNEAAAMIRTLVDGGTVDHDGEHYRVHDLRLSPAPDPPIPVLIGGNGLGVLALAARHANTVQLTGFTRRADGTPDLGAFNRVAAARRIDHIRTVAALAGRAPAIGALIQIVLRTADRRAGARRVIAEMGEALARGTGGVEGRDLEDVVLASPYVLIGTPDQMADQLREQAEVLGITQASVFAARADSDPGIDTLEPVLELLG